MTAPLVTLLVWANSLTPLFTLRLTLSLLILPLLYRALGEPGQGWAGGGAAILRRTAFAALGAFVFFTLTTNWIPEERSPENGRGFQAFVKGSYQFRLSFTAIGGLELSDTPTPGSEKGIKDLREAARLLPESAYFRRYLGIAQAHAGNYTEALQSLEEAGTLLAQRAPEQARVERGIWRRLFATPPPGSTEIETARQQLEQVGLGWIGRVAVLSAYQRLGAKAAPSELRQQVTAEASQYFQRAILGLAFSLLIIPQLGLIIFVVGYVLIQHGILQRTAPAHHAVGAILWEGFILMMSTSIAPVLWLVGGKRPIPEVQPALVAGLLLARDVFQLAAIAYLWVRLRRRGLTLAEIGLDRRRLGANLLVGAASALVVIPAIYLLNIATESITSRLFPTLPPPYHPLQGMTATSGSSEIRTALFLAAVVGAPLLEEIFFRGALYGALRRRFGVTLGILGSSAFFAILHPQLPLGFLPIALLGATFCALYEWRQSLVPGMVAHAVNNGLAFLMLSLMFPMRS